MTLWIFLALLTLASLALILVPWRRRGPEPEAERAVYRDQLAEIGQDQERGLLTAEQAKTARLEVERRLLAFDARGQAKPLNEKPFGILMAAVLSLVVASGAFGLYWIIGRPFSPVTAPSAHNEQAQDQEEAPGHAPGDLTQAVESLAAKLKDNPGDAQGWALLARTQSMLQRWRESADSYRHAMELTGNAPDVTAAYGEMLVLEADGTVGPEAAEAFGQAIAQDPKNVPARYYLGMAAAQAGKPQDAVSQWQALEADSPEDAPWLPSLRQNIAEAAKTAGIEIPSAPAPAPKAVTEADQTMIRSMVARLAARLEKEPGDTEGWQKLARSYRVLGEKEKAADALAKAAASAPKNPAVLLAQARALIEDAGTDKDPSQPIPDAAISALHQVTALEADQPDALWYLGLASAQHHDRKQAQSLWRRLLAKLDPASAQHKAVETALDALTAKKKP